MELEDLEHATSAESIYRHAYGAGGRRAAHFAEEKPALIAHPAIPYSAVLTVERRVSHEDMVSVGGNLYSVPDVTRKRVVEVQNHPKEVRIFEDGLLIAAHRVLEGKNKRRVDPAHRKAPPVRMNAVPGRRPEAARVVSGYVFGDRRSVAPSIGGDRTPPLERCYNAFLSRPHRPAGPGRRLGHGGLARSRTRAMNAGRVEP